LLKWVKIGKEAIEMKTIRFVVDFFPDGRYKLLLLTHAKYKNVWIEKDGTITICFTDDDVKTLKELPKLYYDIDRLNKAKRSKRMLKENF